MTKSKTKTKTKTNKKRKQNRWIWMGRPAHFICANQCQFRLATYIPSSRVIVSTVGDYDPQPAFSDKMRTLSRPADIGAGRKYETFVFHAVRVNDCDGCAYHISPALEIDSLPAQTANDATVNHYALCEKWDDKKRGKKK